MIGTPIVEAAGLISLVAERWKGAIPMRKVVSFILLIALVLLSPNPLEAAVSGAKEKMNPQSRWQSTPDGWQHRTPTPELRSLPAAAGGDKESTILPLEFGKSMEILRGASALAHLKNLQSRRPEIFQKTSPRLRSFGWKPTDTVVVMRTVRDSFARQMDRRVLPAQNVVTDEGELVFWSWDDGDPMTWEGQMYATRYADNAEVISDAQVDTRIDEVIWEDLVYHNPGALSPEIYVSNDVETHPRATLIASLNVSNSPAVPAVFDGKQFMKDWLSCVFATCAGVAYYCIGSSILWVECFILGCSFFIAVCAIATIIEYL